MIAFDKISFNQILILSEVLAESTLFENEFIENKYLKRAANFIETLEFLNRIGATTKKENRIVLKHEYKTVLKKVIEYPNREEFIKIYLINNLILRKNIYTKYLLEFLALFQFKNRRYEFSPDPHQKLAYSGLRNLLISVNILEVDLHNKTYIISDEYSQIYSAKMSPKGLPLVKFLEYLQQRNKLATNAELEALKYERHRLSRFPLLTDKIEYVSIKDVGAGYDIKSFEKSLDNSGQPIPRYIEVKAVSLENYGFYWSRNEIETAKEMRRCYYLYWLFRHFNGSKAEIK